MNKEGKLTPGETMTFAFGSAAGNIVYTFTWVTNIVGRPFWVAVFIGVLLNIPLAVWALFLGSYKEGGTIFDILQDGLGKIVSKIIILSYIALNIALSVCMMNMFAGVINSTFLHFTPAIVIMILIVLLCSLFVDSGISVFAKLTQILVTLYMINFFVGFSFSFVNLFKVENVIPVFDTTYANFFKGILITAGSNAEGILLSMVTIGLTPQTQKQYRSIGKGLFMWSAFLSLAILIMEGDIGHELLSRVAQAGITVGTAIQIGEFVRGLEIPILITYQLFAIVKIMMFLYSCLTSVKKLFNIKKGRLLIIPMALLILVPSAWMNSFNTGYFLAVFLGSYVVLPFVIFVLLLATLSVIIMRIRNGKTAK